MAKSNDALIEILKEKYHYENERKRYYDNVIALPVSLLAFIITGIYFIVTEKYKVHWFEQTKPYLIFPLILSSVLSMASLFKVFFGRKRKYCSFPDTQTVLKDYQNIKEYYADQPQNADTEKNIAADFDKFVITWYKDINKNNIQVNDIRAANFHQSKIFIGISYLLGILIFMMFCIVKLSPNQVQNKAQKTSKTEKTIPHKGPAIQTPAQTPQP